MDIENKVNNWIQEVKSLIDVDLDTAFDLLDEVFGQDNGGYNSFSQEYAHPSNNFNEKKFKSRLKRFVINSYETILDKKIDELIQPEEKSLIMDFEKLYDLNFTHQTKYFTELVQNCKPIVSFVLREKNSFVANWLTKKLIFHYETKVGYLTDGIKTIELDNHSGLDYILLEIAKSMDIEYVPEKLTEFKKRITRQLGNRLESNGIFYIIKNAYNFIHSNNGDFEKLYEIITHIYRENDYQENHKCVFLFVEQNASPYQNNFMLFSHEKDTDFIIEEDEDSETPYFVDLDIVKEITEKCLKTWSKNVGKYREVKTKILDILQECEGNPEKIIPKMAEFIGIDNFKEICIQKGINYNG